MNEFNFSYLTAKTKVAIENDILNAKVGIVKRTIPLGQIKMLYIKEYKDYNELIIRYEKDTGKLKNQKFLFGYGEKDAIALADELSQRLPGIDLRNLEPSEAMKQMKAVNSQKVAFVIAPVVMIAVLAIIFMPFFIHYFDKGHENVFVEDLISGKKLSSRNLTVEGYLLEEGMWEKTTTTRRGSTTTTIINIFPMVAGDWQEGMPIKVLLETDDLTDYEVEALFEQPGYDVTLRNVWWEGASKDQIRFFEDEYGFIMDDDILLLKMSDGSRPDKWAIYVFGACVVIFAIVFAIVVRKYK